MDDRCRARPGAARDAGAGSGVGGQDCRIAVACAPPPRRLPSPRARGRLMVTQAQFHASRSAGLAGQCRVSFEFFPPKTEEMDKTLWESIQRLAPLAASFVSVTYGAGGSTRERTHATVKRILAETALVPAAHLTCVAAKCAAIDAVVRAYCESGVRRIVALRGDAT